MNENTTHTEYVCVCNVECEERQKKKQTKL